MFILWCKASRACVMWLVSWRVTCCPHLIRCRLSCCSAYFNAAAASHCSCWSPATLHAYCYRVEGDQPISSTLTCNWLQLIQESVAWLGVQLIFFAIPPPPLQPPVGSVSVVSCRGLLFIPVMSVKQIIFGQYIHSDATWRQICFKLLLLLPWLYIIDK